MIDIKTKIHDKFSIEFKVGFVVNDKVKDNNFAINTWLFVPNSLDINSSTYGKDQFYRDVKSNVRMITPVFLLRNIVGGEAIPRKYLEKALENVASDPSKQNIADYEYHIKMFSAIVKSSLRNESDHIRECSLREELGELCESYTANVSEIIGVYRRMRRIINVPTLSPEVRSYYSFGDEFMSHIIEHYSFRVLRKIDSMPFATEMAECRSHIEKLIANERAHKKAMGYVMISPDDPISNRSIVFRHSILKKYVESDLYIKLNKKQDGRTVKQIYYSVAAGIAMIFATIIAFMFQRSYGALSMPLFVALVVSYMLKDRIKDLARYYFAHKLGKKYFDNKAVVNIKDHEVGWIKDGVDFITDDKVPAEVLDLRNRSVLLEAENRIFDEKIILYRKLVYINGEELAANNEYNVSGINDIMRLHVTRFTHKMDDPKVPLMMLNEDGSIGVVYTEKVYYLNVVLQFQYEDKSEYRNFKVILTRDGILEIQEGNR